MKIKTRAYLTILASALFLASGTQPASADQLPTGTSEGIQSGTQEPEQTAQITISFDKNGGKGTMDNLDIRSGEKTTLPENTFTKAGFTFAGWSTDKSGNGTHYTDGADVSALAEEGDNGGTVTLYAQWELNNPVIKSVKSPTPDLIKVTYKKHSGADGHEIQYSTNKSFKKAQSIEAGIQFNSVKLWDITPGKTYYVRMRSYCNSGSTKSYSGWCKAVSVKVKSGSTIVNTKS